MPEYEVSPEARWLADSWSQLQEFAGMWIAVVGERVEYASPSLQEVASYTDANDLHPLLAFVTYDDFA